MDAPLVYQLFRQEHRWAWPEMPEGATVAVTPSGEDVRRRPTLPHPVGCSTIGAGWLNFRGRDGSGCFPAAVAAVTW